MSVAGLLRARAFAWREEGDTVALDRHTEGIDDADGWRGDEPRDRSDLDLSVTVEAAGAASRPKQR